jgi:hypothetical protein
LDRGIGHKATASTIARSMKSSSRQDLAKNINLLNIENIERTFNRLDDEVMVD